MKATSVLLLLSALLSTSCKPDPKTKIVKEVEAAGAGNLSAASELSIMGWFEKHQDVAKKINRECAAVTKDATASWAQTTEGRTCSAASNFYDAPVVVPTN